MIFAYGAKNFYSFKNGFDVSFELNENVPSEISKGKKYSNVMGVKGANGSGKTQVLKALSFLARFCCVSFNADEDEFITFDSYFDNKEPSDFYIDFEVKGTRYLYELQATDRKVLRETIYRTNNKKVKILERIENEITHAISSLAETKIIQLKKNASIISTAAKYKFKEPQKDLHDIYAFLLRTTSNVGYSGLRDFPTITTQEVSKFYFNNNDAFEFAKNFITASDLGIHDVFIHEKESDSGKDKEYEPYFVFKHENKETILSTVSQSSGTMALYKGLRLYWQALSYGSTLIFDEFDIHYHELMLPCLIDLFDDPEKNKNNAQFIFTSHNTEIIDQLGKYRTILVNKEDNESYCYRLDEIPGSMIRNDRPISPLYKQGKLGGVPKL